eukprot:scaffold112264_cov32-Tisochrysis_lutea.AAC.5
MRGVVWHVALPSKLRLNNNYTTKIDESRGVAKKGNLESHLLRQNLRYESDRRASRSESWSPGEKP